MRGDKETDDFLAMVHYNKEKICSKKRPTVFIRADNRISKFNVSHINNKCNRFATTMRKESTMTQITSMKDLAEGIKQYNRSLNDTTIVYCKGEAEDDLK